MGDISEMRGLVTVISFIGVLVFMIAIIPPDFLIAEYEGRTVTPPEFFESIDIQSFKETWSGILDDNNTKEGSPVYGYWSKDIDIGDRDFDVIYSEANLTHHRLYFRHYWYEWIIFKQWEEMVWYNTEGIRRTDPPNDWMYSTSITLDMEGESAEYKVEHPNRFFVKVWVGYNTTTYSSVEDAWNNYALYLFVGINFDQAGSGYNAWDLIAMLVFFQLPDLHWIVKALISIPLWVCVGYLAFIFILRAIGAIFGGGGA